ncbi:MAG: MerR family transcriptional regulator [bacterium]|nr:MerR family transcriptional regulator [bacterium]
MTAPDADLPDKLYFKIGEVARLVGVKPYVLRYWETEFAPLLRPEKSHTRHRLYRRRDVIVLRTIRRLLHDDRYTIEGAKRRLRAGEEPIEPTPPLRDAAAALARVRGIVVELCTLLDREPGTPPPLVIGPRRS